MRAGDIAGPRDLRLRAFMPTSRGERLRGLLGRNGLPRDEALLLFDARSIHTFGMRFPITVALLDDGFVVRGARSMPPNRLLLPRPRVRHMLECGRDTDVRPGDRLRFVLGTIDD